MYKTTLLNLGIPKTLPHMPSSGSVQVNQDKDLFKGLRDAYWSDDEVCLVYLNYQVYSLLSRKIEIVHFA